MFQTQIEIKMNYKFQWSQFVGGEILRGGVENAEKFEVSYFLGNAIVKTRWSSILSPFLVYF